MPCCDFKFVYLRMKKMRQSTRTSKTSYAARCVVPCAFVQRISRRFAHVCLMISSFEAGGMPWSLSRAQISDRLLDRTFPLS